MQSSFQSEDGNALVQSYADRHQRDGQAPLEVSAQSNAGVAVAVVPPGDGDGHRQGRG